MGSLPEAAYAAALASVPGVGPRTLQELLGDRSPSQAWRALVGRGGGALGVPAAVVRAARALDVAAQWDAYVRENVAVVTPGDAGYPVALAGDPRAPAVLFGIGDPTVVDRHARVAIVGTRSATRYGLGVAAQLAGELTAAGIVVVSGLALGIDGAAHEGAVAAWRAAGGEDGGAAPPVAVVAGSVTAPYPRQHAGLWARVAQAGAVLSEAAIGSADLAWRFPMRNRIIAALAHVVVVVECHAQGGSLHTVRSAAARGIPVGAVPGSVRSPASAGTNALLADGCFVVRDLSDVLVAVGIATAARPVRAGRAARAARRPPDVATPSVRNGELVPPVHPRSTGGRGPGRAGDRTEAVRDDAPAGDRSGGDREEVDSEEVGSEEVDSEEVDSEEVDREEVDREEVDREEVDSEEVDSEEVDEARRAVLDALGWERCSLDDVVGRTGLTLGAVCSALEVLRARGVVHGEGGSWERA